MEPNNRSTIRYVRVKDIGTKLNINQQYPKIVKLAQPIPEALPTRSIYWFVASEQVDIRLPDGIDCDQKDICYESNEGARYLYRVNVSKQKAITFVHSNGEERIHFRSSSKRQKVLPNELSNFWDEQMQLSASNCNIQQLPAPLIVNIILCVPEDNEERSYIQMIDSVLTRIGYEKEVSSVNQHNLYRSTVNIQRHVLVVLYGRVDRLYYIQQSVQYASECILLIENGGNQSDDLLTISCVKNINDVANQDWAFEVKAFAAHQCIELGYSSLSEQQKLLFFIPELRDTVLGGICYQNKKGDQLADLFCNFFMKWTLSAVTKFCTQNIYLCFMYVPKLVEAFTSYASCSLKVLGIEHTLAVSAHGSVLVFIRCPSYMPWLVRQKAQQIFATLHDKGLHKIFECFVGDVDVAIQKPENEEFLDELTYLKEQMICDGIPDKPTKKRFEETVPNPTPSLPTTEATAIMVNECEDDTSRDLDEEEEKFMQLLEQRSVAHDEFHQKLTQASNLYDAGINIDTLRGFPRGWTIFGKQAITIPKKDGRVISVFSGTKSGKTWFLRRLSQVTLMDDKAIHSLGLSVKFPDAPATGTSKPQPEVPTTTKKNLLKNILANAKNTLDFIVLDAAGGDVPTSEELLEDQVATEAYLRELIINTANAVVFLCSKYTRSTQITLNSLIGQINNLGLDKQKITPENRIFVIHNEIAVDKAEDIENPTQELVNLYEEGHINPDVRDADNGVVFWQTNLQTHVFLANDHSCKEYNDRVFELLRTDLRKYNVTRDFSFLDHVMEFTKKNLKRFVQGMENPQLEIYSDGTNACLRPVLKQNKRTLKLKELNILVGGSVSENSLDLKVLTTILNKDKSYYEFKIEVPGVKSMNRVKYMFLGIRTLKVVVQTSDLAPTSDEAIVYNTRQYGKRVYTWKAPKDAPFAEIKILDQKLEDGLLEFKIERAHRATMISGHEVSNNNQNL